jgi:2-keto-4-pentenoate hydratase
LGAKVQASLVESEEIARHFVTARQSGASLPDYPGQQPRDLREAYAIQTAALSLVQDDIVGWKVGRIQPPRSEELGVDRLSGPIFASQVQTISGNAVNIGTIFDGGFGAAEAEFIFRVGSPPTASHSALTLDEAAEAIDAVFAGFEIASSPFPGINSGGPLVTISDFGNNNGLIIGPEIPDWQDVGLDKWTVETRADGKVLGAGQASSFPDGPIGSVRFLLNHLIERNISIPAGMLISTGAVTGVHEVTAGQNIESRFGSDIKIECKIANVKAL